MLTVDPHPLLDLRAIRCTWSPPLGEQQSPEWLLALATLQPPPELPAPDDQMKKAVRDLLRHGGFKPAGRGKPCSEYIRNATGKDQFPRINPAVDATNLAALHGALPVSTIDLDLLEGDLRIGIAGEETSYVFNTAGQEIRLDGLLCLFDGRGPCANAVKDSQRAKTTADTTRTLTVLWGTTAIPGRSDALLDWFTAAVRRLGAEALRVA